MAACFVNNNTICNCRNTVVICHKHFGTTCQGHFNTLIDLAAKLEVKNATLMWPVRIAAAGKLVTPGGAVEICHILGKDETLRRLRLGLDKLRA